MTPGKTTLLAGVLGLAALIPAGPAVAATLMPAEQVLASFSGHDGAGPLYGVIAGPGGVLYGTTVFGGGHRDGCVFELVPAGSGYTEKILFSFGGADGSKPGGNVAADAHGDLVGETVIGGSHGQGVVYELTPSGPGYAERVLHSPAASAGQPQAGLALASDGTVYGTLYGASAVHTDGSIFRVALSGARPG